MNNTQVNHFLEVLDSPIQKMGTPFYFPDWKGIEASDYLGACSYKDQKDFEQPGGYYDDMKGEAYSALIKKIEDLQ